MAGTGLGSPQSRLALIRLAQDSTASIYTVSATSSVTVTGLASESDVVTVHNVSAATSFTVSGHGSETHSRDPGAPPGDVAASASSSFVVNSSNIESLNSAGGSVTAVTDHSLTVSGVASAYVGHQRSVGATNSIIVSGGGNGVRGTANYLVHGADKVKVSDDAEQAPTRLWPVGAADVISVKDRASELFNTHWAVGATSRVVVADFANEARNAVHPISARDVVIVSTSGSESADFHRPATASIVVSTANGSGREFSVSAATSVRLSSPESASNNYFPHTAATGASVTGLASAVLGHPNATDVAKVVDSAGATISLANTLTGNAGPATLLRAGVSGHFPMSFAETPSGLVIVADGVDPMFKWDGLAALADTAGIQPPALAVALGGTGVGTITGRRVAYCRFVDALGNVSNLSPVSNQVDFGRSVPVAGMTVANGVVTVQSPTHGLVTGEQIVMSGALGLQNVNGLVAVHVVDSDNFTLTGIATSGTYAGGACWTWGVAYVAYSNLPVSAETKVVRRQILRNLDGDASVFYVDIDTTDLTSTSLMSASSDEMLAAGQPVPLFFDDDLPSANRYGPPPSHKAVVCAHLGRIFATTDVTITEGSVLVTLGSPVVVGTGTNWQSTFAGRMLYVLGASAACEIASVDPVNQVITLTAPYAGMTNRYAQYAIRSAPGERKLVYYSEPSLPESWPPWNAIALPEDSDDITGLMVKGSFLYILEKRHTYRFTFQQDPATDGYAFLSVLRGCLNNRCWVQVEDAAYMLDEVGVHAFDGGQASTPISNPIQNLFQLDGESGMEIDWSADQTLWHAAHDPVRDTIRWFVHFVGDTDPVHALCYDYRLQRWWIEQYPTAVTASCVATIGYRRSIVGTTNRQVLCLSEGTLDGVYPQAGLRGKATSATSTTLADSSGIFPVPMPGVPVTIVSGTGRGQQGVIATNDASNLTLIQPWAITPDATSIYQVGGVQWSWRSGWFRHDEDNEDNARDVEIVFQPLQNPATLDLSLYYDHSATPRNWAYSKVQDGVTTSNGSPFISVDMSVASKGYAVARLTGHRDRYSMADRFVSIEMSGVGAGEIVRVFQVGVLGSKEGQ